MRIVAGTQAKYNRTKRSRAAAAIANAWKNRSVRKAVKMYSKPKNKQTHFHIRRINTTIESGFSVDTSGGIGAYHRAISFKLSDLENYTELSSLYDQYMITKVVLDFQWTLTGVSDAGGIGPNASYSPQLNFIRDYTDSTVAVAADFRESSRVIRKRLTANNPFRLALTPAVQSEVYESALATAYSPKWHQRVSMADFNVPHYGVKFQILCPALDVGFVQCTAKYYVSCYQTK